MSAALTGLLALAVTLATFSVWLRKVKQVNIPRSRIIFHGLMGFSLATGIYALANSPGWIGGPAATLAVLLASFYFILRAQSSQSRTPPLVSVGDSIIDFAAPDDEGNTFQLSSLQGTPFLLKFFRGHW